MNYKSYRNRLFEYQNENFYPVLSKWISDEDKIIAVNEHVDEVFKAVIDENTGKGLMEIAKYEHATRDDYRTHLLELDEFYFVILKIGLMKIKDVITSYIQVFDKNFNFKSIGEEQLKKIIGRYSVFSPKYIRYYENGNENLEEVQEYKIEKDTYEIAGPVALTQSMQKPVNADDIEIEEAENMNFYDEYSAEYDQFHGENFEHKVWAAKEKYEKLESILNQKNLYLIKIGGEIAGVSAFEKIQMPYGRCWLVVEKFLYKKFRSHGFGLASHMKSIDLIQEDSNLLLYGTVAVKNIASLKTAQDCKREIYGTNYLMMLK